MNKQQLAAKIWESANQMRSKIEANEYKDYILGFIFYKYLSDQLVQFVTKEGMTPEDIEALNEKDADTLKYIQDNLGYFVSYDNLFSTWIDPKHEFDESNVRDALSAFSRLISPTYKKLFEGIFTTLETGLSKLGESAGKRYSAGVTHHGRNGLERLASFEQTLDYCDAPGREVVERGQARHLSKVIGKACARHACGFGQRFQRPCMAGPVVHGRDRFGQTWVAQRRQDAGGDR